MRNWTQVEQGVGETGGFIRVEVDPDAEVRAQNEYLKRVLDAIGKIPGVRDRAGVGDGSVHAAVVAMYGALVSAEAERDALRTVIPEVPWRYE